jgi:hypothetical protein
VAKVASENPLSFGVVPRFSNAPYSAASVAIRRTFKGTRGVHTETGFLKHAKTLANHALPQN